MDLTLEERLCYLASQPGMSARRFWLLRAACPGDPWESISIHNERLAFLSPPALNGLVAAKARMGRAFLDAFSAVGVQFISFLSPRYPQKLLSIENPPPFLFYKGNWHALRAPIAGLVGTRHPTPGAAATAFSFAKALAEAGAAVISGMAAGIDTAAHRGALEGGVTVAVLGCGPERPYPAENRGLHREIMERGLVLSEFPPGTPPLAQNFPLRNRIISGLSGVLLVGEAGERSGALITAACAKQEGVPVLCIPQPGSNRNQGGNELIRSGVPPALEPADALRELGLREKATPAAPVKAPTEGEKEITAALLGGPRTADELSQLTGLPPARLNALLTFLELSATVEQLPGRLYRLR